MSARHATGLEPAAAFVKRGSQFVPGRDVLLDDLGFAGEADHNCGSRFGFASGRLWQHGGHDNYCGHRRRRGHNDNRRDDIDDYNDYSTDNDHRCGPYVR